MQPKLTGDRRCRCGACHQSFNAVSTFDHHRTGPYAGTGANARRCLSTDEMIAKGWHQNVAGFWCAGSRPNFQRLN
jgi:hypothetical protein